MIVHIETEIDASADKVWKILAHEYADIADWTDTLSESRVVNVAELPDGYQIAANAPVPARETTSPFVKAIEVIYEYSEAKRELKFEALNLPPMLSHARNHQQVLALGENKSKVIFDIDLGFRHVFNLLAPLMKRRFHKTMSGVQQELSVYARAKTT